jgi:hypothetical protein
MIVLSDGRQVGPEADPAAVEAANAPIFAAPMFGARVQRRDVAIARIVSPDALLAGESAVVRVELSSVGLRGAEVEVQLSAAGGAAQTQRVAIGEDGSASAQFPVRFEHSGVQKVEASVAPQPGEAVQENNRARRWVKVSADRARVALVGDFADRESAAVRDALAREPWLRLEEAPMASATNAPPQPAAISPEALESQDVIILRDVGVSQLSEQQWNAITRMVNDRGGSVILCAGEAHWPGEYADYAPAARLLPYDASVMPTWRTWPGDRPTFRFAAAAPAAGAGGAGGEGDAADRAAPWPQLPPVARFMPVPRSQSAAATARPLLVERTSGAAVLTEANVGAGRAFVLGTDETWRWSPGAGAGGGAAGGASAAFWPRLVRRALREPFAGHAGNLSLDAEPIAPQPAQATHIRARVLAADGTPMTQATWPLIISHVGTEVRRVTMSAGAAPGRYDTTLSDLSEGEYTLRIEPPPESSQEFPAADALEIPLYVESTSEAELADVSGDETLLRRMADASGGGQVVPPEQLSSLPQRLAELRAGQNEFVRYPLWDSPYLYALVVASLSAEWALRKRWGLA